MTETHKSITETVGTDYLTNQPVRRRTWYSGFEYFAKYA